MYFGLFQFWVRKSMKGFALLSVKRDSEEGAYGRSLLSVAWEKLDNGDSVFFIHFLWNWNKAWLKEKNDAP